MPFAVNTKTAKQLLNERLALALGWKKRHETWWIAPATSRYRGGNNGPVDFCTSTNADELMDGCKRRGWGWCLSEVRPAVPAYVVDGKELYPAKPAKYRAAISTRSPLRDSPIIVDSPESIWIAFAEAFAKADEVAPLETTTSQRAG